MTDFEFFSGRYQYDPLTGIISAKVSTWGGGCRIPIGTPLGHVSAGKVILSVSRNSKNRYFRAHRVAWLLMTGAWPTGEIDHIDRNATNNRWSNLRLATRSQQGMNRGMQRNNTSGFTGVVKNGTNWMAWICRDRKRWHLGTYKTKEEAYAVYCKARQELHGTYARAD